MRELGCPDDVIISSGTGETPHHHHFLETDYTLDVGETLRTAMFSCYISLLYVQHTHHRSSSSSLQLVHLLSLLARVRRWQEPDTYAGRSVRQAVKCCRTVRRSGHNRRQSVPDDVHVGVNTILAQRTPRRRRLARGEERKKKMHGQVGKEHEATRERRQEIGRSCILGITMQA